MADYQMLGTYKIEVTRESLAEAAKHSAWGDDWLTETGELKEDMWEWYLDERAEEKDTIALIEASITGKYSRDELLGFTHGAEQQAPWHEFYLDDSGTKQITYEEAVAAKARRICFFLHFVDVSQPIEVRKGQKVIQTLPLPPMNQLPERLKPFCFYMPPD